MALHASLLPARLHQFMARLHPIQCSAVARAISSSAHAPFRSVRSIRSTSTAAVPEPERQGRDARPREAAPGRPRVQPLQSLCRTFIICPTVARAFTHRERTIMSERLKADVLATAVASINQESRRFGDARVVLEDILHLGSDEGVPGMPSRHGRTTADSNGRVSVALPGIALFPPASLTPAWKRHNSPGSVPASA